MVFDLLTNERLIGQGPCENLLGNLFSMRHGSCSFFDTISLDCHAQGPQAGSDLWQICLPEAFRFYPETIDRA